MRGFLSHPRPPFLVSDVLAAKANPLTAGNREPVLPAMPRQILGYASVVEWTPVRIRLLREVGLCESQHDFAKTLGVATRTVGNAERGTHPPSLALRRALDQALENSSVAQRDRFLAAVAADHAPSAPVSGDREPHESRRSQASTGRSDFAVVPGPPFRSLNGLRNEVLGSPTRETDQPEPPRNTAAVGMAAAVQAHRRYQLADYDGAAQLLTRVLTRAHCRGDTGPDEYQPVGTLTTRHVTAAAYLAAAKLATKSGDVVLASVTADRAMTAAKESEHPALVGAATYQVACALLLTGELTDAEQIATTGEQNIARVLATPHLNSHQEALSVRGSLLLLLAIIAARRADRNAAQKMLREAGLLAGQLGGDGNWLWTAFGPTNVAIHQLSVESRLGNTKSAMQLGADIKTDTLPAVLRGRRSQVHLELGWSAAGQGDDATAVLHLLEAERVAEQAVSRNKSATTLLRILLARERRSVTPGLRGLASRAGVLR